MTSAGFGGSGYSSPQQRALSSIANTADPDTTSQDKLVELLQQHTYQIRFLAANQKQLQKGVNDATANPIQQIQKFIADVIVLLGGGQLAEGLLDFGDLQYILPVLGALFGFDADAPFPLSLFDAAEKFFLGYVVPNAQFADVINKIIEEWAKVFGIDPKFVHDVKALITAFGDLFDGLENLLPSLNELFSALGITGTDLGPLGQALAPIVKLFSGIDIAKFGNAIEFITDAIDPFIVQLTAIINFIDSILAVLGYDGGTVVNSPLGDTTLPFNNLLSFLADINFGSPDFDPIAAAVQFIENVLSPTGLLTTVTSIIQGLFGIPGGDQSTLTMLGSNLMALLGLPDLNMPTGSFDPITAAEQMLQGVLTPAGALSTFTQLPSHLFGNLNTGSASSNLLPDGSFDDQSSLHGQGLWNWSSAGRTKPGSASTTAAGVLRPLIGVPIHAIAADITQVSAYVKWSGVTASAGSAIVLAVNAYDANDTPISDPANRVVAAITTPGASSIGHAGADANGWVPLVGEYQAPAGTAYLRISPEVESIVTAGTVWFDDCVQTLQTGLVDASVLKNIENIPELLITSVQGFAGLLDLANTWQHMVDGLGSAYHPTGSVSGIDFTDLFSLAQGSTQNAITALEKAIENTLVLGNRTNKPTSAGVNPTSEAMMTLGHFSSSGSMTTTSVAAGTAISQMFRAGESAVKGFFEFLAAGTGVTNIFVNIYHVDPTTKVRTALWNSGNIASQIPTSLGYVRALIPGGSQPSIAASDNLQLEIVNNGSAALTVVTKSTGAPNHPTDFPTNVGATRTLSGTGGASPSTLTDAQVVYSSTVPYVNLGISNVPADYHAPESFPYTTPGTFSLVLPSWLTAGDLVDLIGIGGGGGGGGSQFYLTGQGGGGAAWGATTLTVGTHIKIGSTLTIVVGAGGAYGSAGNAGGNGGLTTVTYVDPSNNPHTITIGAAGPYGGPGISHNGANPNSTSSGAAPSPQNETYNGITYFGGGTVSSGNNGAAPGGGGGGAVPYGGGYVGGRGELTVVGRQA